MFLLKSKYFIAVMVILVIISFASSCQKEAAFEPDETIEETLKSLPVSDYSLDKISILENKQNVEKLLLNPEDRDDEKINKYLYELSLATRELIKDAKFNSIIIELAKESENQTANLLELEKTAPEYFREINRRMSTKGLTVGSIYNDLTYRPVSIDSKSPEIAELQKYVPSIFIPNLAYIDASKQPLISSNIEVDCTNDESIEDNIIAWYYTKGGEMKEILLSEETSLKTTNPLFLLDNASPNVKVSKGKFLPPETSSKSTTTFHSNEYRINRRYEDIGNSEFCIVASYIAPDGLLRWVYNSSGWKKIDEVRKRDIGKNLSRWTSHCGNYTPYEDNFVFWNTYERDWNRSQKTLGHPEAYNTTMYLAGRMKYTHNWYGFDPSTLASDFPSTDLNYIYWNWAKWYSSSKSDYRIWRVEL